MTTTIWISSLPELALLEVFAHLPLLDLLRSVPLVCQSWHSLQPTALRRRLQLHLGSLTIRPFDKHVTKEPNTMMKVNDSNFTMNWCTDDQSTGVPLECKYQSNLTEVEHNRLCVLSALCSDRGTAHLVRTMPHLSELTAVISNRMLEDKDGHWALVKVFTNLTRLLRHYTTSLGVLRLCLLHEVPLGLDELVATVNTLSRLHSLQLHLHSPAKEKLSERFSSALLSQLRCLVVSFEHGAQEDLDHLFGELRSSTTTKSLHPSLSIVYHPPAFDYVSILAPFLTRLVAPHMRVISVRSVTTEAFRLSLDHFRRLTALQVKSCSGRSLHQVLSALTSADGQALPELTCLALKGFSISTTTNQALNNNTDETEQLPVLSSVRRLTLVTSMIAAEQDHSITVAAFHLGQCFPTLEWLKLMLNFGRAKCCARHRSARCCQRAVLQTLANSPPPHLTTVHMDSHMDRPKRYSLVRITDRGNEGSNENHLVFGNDIPECQCE